MVFVFVNRDVFQQGTALKPAQYQPLVRQVCAVCTSCLSVALSLFGYIFSKIRSDRVILLHVPLKFKICL